MINKQQNPDDDLPTKPSFTDSEIASRLDSLWNLNSSQSSKSNRGQERLEIGPYRIDEPIGAGAFGVVYKAHHLQDAQVVALKIPHPEWLSNPDALKRFENEARTCACLDHESIVPLISADLTGKVPFIASEFIDGPDLAEWLSTCVATSRNTTDIALFAIRIVHAVTYAHQMGVIHRDIKPSNILMLPQSDRDDSSELNDFSPKLADFGLAKLTLEPIVNSRSSLIIGTPMMIVNAVLMAGPLYQGNGRVSDLIQCLGLAFGINIVIPVLCLLRIYGIRWATKVALAMSIVVNGIVPVLILSGVMPSFEGLYSNAPLFRITNHMMVLFYGIVQSTLLGISVYSDSVSTRRR